MKNKKLLGLVQPKEYTSKIKLYTNKCEFSVKVVSRDENNNYICRDKINQSDYCGKGRNNYCKTAREFITKGMNSPIKLDT